VYLQTEMLGYLIATILLVFIILIGGLDVASGLRAYHFSASLMTWLTLLVGGIGIVYLWIKQKSSFLRTIRHIAIYSLFVIVVYLPWPIKNFVESGSISLSTLIEGKQTGPSKSVKEFIQNANN